MASTDSFFSVCLMTTMDRLWFHQIILSQTDPSAGNSLLLCPLSDNPISPQSSLLNLLQETSSDSLPQLPQTQEQPEENSPDTSSVSLITSTTTPHQEEEQKKSERPTRLSLENKRTRSHSSSPSTQKRHRLKNLKYSSSSTSLSGTKIFLEKSMSCKTLGELELEEVKGFIDLGFTFKIEDLSSRIMSLVPGLHRIGIVYKNKLHKKLSHLVEDVDQDIETDHDHYHEHDVEIKGVMRPYLSEAWLIKRPDSPLLNLRVPRVSMPGSSDDDAMKKHLRFWAKTVALEMQQEC